MSDIPKFSATVNGRPLSELGLENARIIDADGNDIGPLQGFICLPGKTLLESVMASLPEGCTLHVGPRTH